LLQTAIFLLLCRTHRYLCCNSTRLCKLYVTHKSSRPRGKMCVSAVLSAKGIW
jgi:hypothetical protein